MKKVIKETFWKAGSGDGPSTSSPGDVIATFEDPTLIWNQLVIDGIKIDDIIKESLIVTWD